MPFDNDYIIKENNTEIDAKKYQLELPNGDFIALNNQQINAYESLIKFINNDSEYTFTLAGYAGTGKTTMIKKFIENILASDKRIFNKDICVTAPTHKAKKVIEKSTGLISNTIQSICGIAPRIDLDNFNPNNPEFGKRFNASINQYKIIILDEASMVNRYLFKMIKKLAIQYRVKIIFMGDIAQLPPINETVSSCFLTEEQVLKLYNEDIMNGIEPNKSIYVDVNGNDEVEFIYGVNEFSQLTLVERQAHDNPLMGLFDKMRETINENSSIILPSSNKVNSKGGYFYLDVPNEFKAKLLEYFTHKNFDKDVNFAKACAWRNSTVKSMNQMIRQEKFGANVSQIVVGDRLMAFHSVMDKSNRKYNLRNSEEYRVLDVMHKSEYGYTYFETLVEDEDNEQRYFKILDNSDSMSLLQFESRLHKIAKSAYSAKGHFKSLKWKSYYKLKGEYLLLGDILTGNRVSVTQTINYGFACTIHKLQGSTCENVFINGFDIMQNRIPKLRNQLFYVAMTRPTKRAFMLGHPQQQMEI